MAFVGFAVMSPIATQSMLDNNRWRPVVYADTPKCLSRYEAFLEAKESRKAILFVLGSSNLHRVAKDLDRFASVFVFDDLQNLDHLCNAIPGFDVVDIEVDEETGTFEPAHLSPAELAEVVKSESSVPDVIPLLTKVKNALGKRKPSVLESTSRMPTPDAVPDVTGSQRLMGEIKLILEAQESELPFSVVLDSYTKFLFRLLSRSKLTSQVTKKLSDEAKELWMPAIDLATSDVGLRMAYAFRSLCEARDPDYRVGHAVSRYGLKAYSGDFLYFTSILSPNRSFEFLPELSDDREKDFMADRRFIPSGTSTETKKKRAKKA
jgi:hypothetical protein